MKLFTLMLTAWTGLTLLVAGAAFAAETPAAASAPEPMPSSPEPAPSVMRLPAGHPDISQMTAGEATTQPATAAVAASGKLAIRVRQGTAGGAAISQKPITIELLHRGQPIRKIDTKLDEHGVAMVEDLPLAMPVQPVVVVEHAGVSYQAVGKLMDPGHPEQKLELAVYETTEQAPAWQVGMQHMIVHKGEQGGVHVTEMLSVTNPGDRTWLGKADGQGGRSTFALPLPAGATELSLGGGLQETDVKVVPGEGGAAGQLVITAPMMPGTVQYQVGYVVPPLKDGQATLTLTAPAPVARVMVFVPEDLGPVIAKGLEQPSLMRVQDGTRRMLKATNVPAGQEMSVTLSGLTALAAAGATPASAAAGSLAPQIIAAVGGVLVLVCGAAILLVKARGAASGAGDRRRPPASRK